jgi:hypothetical protein
MKPVCICSYVTGRDRFGRLFVDRKTEPKCPEHGTKATEN